MFVCEKRRSNDFCDLRDFQIESQKARKPDKRKMKANKGSDISIYSAEKVEDNEQDRLKKDALLYGEDLARRGVVFMSRVPPFMKPNKVRVLLEPYGEITRLFLAEEGKFNDANVAF
jgi:ESF2/ABP1 family protein